MLHALVPAYVHVRGPARTPRGHVHMHARTAGPTSSRPACSRVWWIRARSLWAGSAPRKQKVRADAAGDLAPCDIAAILMLRFCGCDLKLRSKTAGRPTNPSL